MSTLRRRALRTAAASLSFVHPPPPCPAFRRISTSPCCRCMSSLRISQRPQPTPYPPRPRLPPLNASLVPTSSPLPRIPPSAPAAPAGPVSLRPPHFLKQFFLRVHPDLFHAPFVRVQHTALVTDDDDDASQQQPQRLAEPITIVTAGVEEVREAEVSSAMMREVNEANVARLNELMQYYKQLQALGESTPLVVALPRPPTDSGHFAFYCKQPNDSFTYLAHRYTPAQTSTPIIALHAIDSFLSRLLLSAGIAIPSSLVQRWKADWASRRRSSRYERVKKHMPWMMDDTKRAADDRQRDMIRRDYEQVKLHSTPLSLSQRAQYAMQTMYSAGLIQLSERLTDDERLQGTRAFGAMVGAYAHQLHMDEWLGSVVRIGSEAEGYGWELGVLRLPFCMTKRRMWETCNEYVQALTEARAKLQESTTDPAAATAESTTEEKSEAREPAAAEAAAAEGRERLLSAEWAEQQQEDATSVTEDDPDWQLTAQEVRERRNQPVEQPRPAPQQHSPATSADTAQRRLSVARRSKPTRSAADWLHQLEQQEEAWLKKRLSGSDKQQIQ